MKAFSPSATFLQSSSWFLIAPTTTKIRVSRFSALKRNGHNIRSVWYAKPATAEATTAAAAQTEV